MKRCGVLLSTYTVGPLVPSFSGCCYLILFKVAFSKCQFTFVTITKSTRDVLDYLKKVSNHAKTVGQPIREWWR